MSEARGGRYMTSRGGFDRLRATLVRAVDANRVWPIAGAALLLSAVALLTVAGYLGVPLSHALAGLSRVHLIWLSVAAISLAAGVVSTACAWRCALRMCGGNMCGLECGASYGVGSLVNSLLPGHLGGAVRVGLFSRGLIGSKRLWVAGGIPAAIGTGRSMLLAVLVVAAVVGGSLPVWMAVAVGAAGCALAGLCLWARRSSRRENRFWHLLEVFRALGRSPGDAAWLLGWLACSVAAQIGAVTAVVESLGVSGPFAAALVIVPLLAVTSCAAILPAGLGVTTGAVTVILHQRGVDTTTALAAGIALNAVETTVGFAAGIASACLLAFPTPAARRWTLVSVTAAFCVVIASTAAAGPLGKLA
jgi:uncharacterized membrane protein YbhN (UPF0104 family)